MVAATASVTTVDGIYPSPHFEGAEKRIEIDFHFNERNPRGLREIARAQLDECMTAAQCEIVSVRSNDKFDAYVLSESSLFVFPTKLVLKTCGTTHLLAGVPNILKYAAEVGMEPRRVKFTRSSFDKPDLQPELHASFDDETAFLEKHFGNLSAAGGSSYILGSKLKGVQWARVCLWRRVPVARRQTEGFSRSVHDASQSRALRRTLLSQRRNLCELGPNHHRQRYSIDF